MGRDVTAAQLIEEAVDRANRCDFLCPLLLYGANFRGSLFCTNRYTYTQDIICTVHGIGRANSDLLFSLRCSDPHQTTRGKWFPQSSQKSNIEALRRHT